MNRAAETLLRFVNLTASGLLAGSLGFGEAILTPGSREERTRRLEEKSSNENAYFNAIGPIALATSVTLAVASRGRASTRKVLDVASALGLAGVLATTTLVTVPLNKKIEVTAPVDYPDGGSRTLIRNFGRAHAIRTVLGISAFVCAVASSSLSTQRSR
ncbi:MAG TPA: DUF1772 domain-containing protein [Thermoanaerobaculia bacterium]|nr:DUF1772 domain-containing protein [Thermoanaerobaculia bacterium]